MRFWLIILTLCFAGCSRLPQKYTPEELPMDAPAHWTLVAPGIAGKHDLLSLVPTPDIDHWIDMALRDNPALRRSLLEVAEAGILTNQVKANQLPSIDLSIDAQREKNAASQSTTNNFSASLTTTWEVDIWGRLRDQTLASEMDASAIEADFEFAKRSLAANVLKAWLSWLSAIKKLEVEERRFQTLLKNSEFVQERYVLGIGDILDLETSKSDSEQAKARVAGQLETVQTALRLIQGLTGSFKPLEGLPDSWTQVAFPSLILPAQVIGQRPDLRAAYRRIQAADALSSVAYKNLLPSFSLNLNINQSQPKLNELLTRDPGWLLLGQIIQPIFNHGRLKAELEASESRAHQAYWSYRELLVKAILEVEGSLSQEHSYAIQYASLESALHYAKSNQKEYENRYRQGLVSMLDLLSAQQSTFDVEVQLLDVALNRAVNRINLGLALGMPIKSGA